MTIPESLTNIIGKWKIYAIGAGALLISYIAVGLWQHSVGYSDADSKWKTAVTAAKVREVGRDTNFTAQKPDSGRFVTQPAAATVRQLEKIRAGIKEAATVIGAQKSRIDSLETSNAQLKAYAERISAPKLGHLKTPEIGDLWFWFFPADSTANIYRHEPPPLKTITVTTEKLVLQPRSDWETAGYIAIGVGVGVLAAILTHAH